MWWKNSGFWALACALGLMTWGCHESRPGYEERCNLADDDWDGEVDEDFKDHLGRYHTISHCGACGIDCDALFPTAERTACEDSPSGFTCAIASCPAGTHLLGTSVCVPDIEVLCAPCSKDEECRRKDPKARCLPFPDGTDHCAPACGEDPAACGEDAVCTSLESGDYCLPRSGHCGCGQKNAGQTFGCWILGPYEDESVWCQGKRTCDGENLSDCEPSHEEICDGLDNNCDGRADEGLLIDGHYLTKDHCGACNHPCVALGPNMTASCELEGGAAICVRGCASGHVDLDGLAINGCECRQTSAVWPPSALGGDMDCDGTIDDTAEFVFVSKSGDDKNPGTLLRPVRTIGRGIDMATGSAGRKTVLVAQGTYDEQVEMSEGVSVFGGYRSDFKDRDLSLFAAILFHQKGPAGAPALIARDIDAATEVDGFTVRGTDAAATGQGTTAVALFECGPALSLSNLLILAGDGKDGAPGISSSQILSENGVSPADLDGVSGRFGEDGVGADSLSCSPALYKRDGGRGGQKSCLLTRNTVSGGNGGDASCPRTGCVIGRPCGNGGCSDFTIDGVCDYDAVYEAAVPNPAAEDGRGDDPGAAGPLTYDAPTTRASSNFCDDNPTLRREGGDGGRGRDGRRGGGGTGCELVGTFFDVKTGLWRSAGGSDGTDGEDGSGGGGGTQGNGYDALLGASVNRDYLGGAGGGGGSGGCGAPGATGGGGGGSSIGVVIVLRRGNAGPALTDVRVIPGRAGDGGDGGFGASGGAGGQGGRGGEGSFWCARRGGGGGDGGQGGDSGGGGGGCGGSVSGFHVVPRQTPPAGALNYIVSLKEKTTVDAIPAGGSGGNGGFSPSAPGSDGQRGDGVPFRLFDPDLL